MSIKRNAIVLLAAAGLGGCVWTSEGGFTQRYESDWEGTAHSEPDSWDGEPIRIVGDGGRIVIVGVEGKRNISLATRFSAGARDEADAEAAFRDTAASLSIELREDTWFVECNEAQETHGSVVPSSTGCVDMAIEVPAGNESAPLSLSATTSFGGIHASGLIVESLSLRAPFGLVADVTPVDGATMSLFGESLVSGMCNSILRVPSDTAFESLSLSVSRAESLPYVGGDPDNSDFWLESVVRGFDDAPDLPRQSSSLEWTREASGAQVETATVHASIGKAVVTTGAVPDPYGLTLCAYLELGNGPQTSDPG